MGELGDDVVFEVKLSPYGSKILQSKISKQISKQSVWRTFYNIVYDNDQPLGVKQYVNKQIDIWVPSDTGDLRQALKNAITPSGGSTTQDFPFKVVLNTEGIPYAKPVNKMPEEYIQHSPGQTYHKTIGRTGKKLNDPKTKKGWYNLILINGRKKAKNLVQEFLKTIATDFVTPVMTKMGISGTAYNEVKKWFSIRFV